MKNIRGFFLPTIILVFISALISGCSSVSSGDLIGVWTGAWEYEGNQINTSVQFERNGEYISVDYVNGNLSSIETGTYIVKKNEVILQVGGNPGKMIPYKYSGGKLKNGGHSFSKENSVSTDLRSLAEPNVDELIQGTWENYDSETDSGERCTFDDGEYVYTTFHKKTSGADRTIAGAYRIDDGRIYIKADYYFDYKIDGSEIVLSITPDGGYDSGIPRVFQKIE